MLEHPSADVAVNVDVLFGLAGVGIWVGKVARAAEHGQNDRERVLGVVERDMENRASIDDSMNRCIVICTCRGMSHCIM